MKVDYTIMTDSGKELYADTLAEAKRIANELLEDNPIIDKSIDEELADVSYYYRNGKWVKVG